MATSPTVVLVHGAFMDASGYGAVIRKLQSKGIEVTFVPAMKASSNWVGEEPSGLPEVHYYLDADGRVILKKLLGQ